jgi:signal transduction histidine kinase
MGSFIRPNSLFFKVILISSLILVFAISFNVWWNMALYESSLERITKDKAKIISEYIEASVVRAMERGRHYDMQGILKNFALYRGIRKINIFSPDGVILATTEESSLKQKITNLSLYTDNETFTLEEYAGPAPGKGKTERIFYYNKKILNNPACHQCHGKKREIIGILTVAKSLSETDEMVSKVKLHSIILAIITIGFLSGSLILLYLRLVERPVRRLTEAMRKVEGGDLRARANLSRQDEMGRLAESLNGMIEKLHQARNEAEAYHQELIQRADRLATIGELASGIAHEIRNPLAGIHGAIKILADTIPQEDSRREVTDEIQKQIQKLNRLVKDLLNYVRPVPRKQVHINVNSLLDKVLAFFTTQQKQPQGLRIIKEYSDSLPEAFVDPSSMEQAFLNILLNAQRSMPNGGALTITTSQLNSNNIQIVLGDTGEGIPERNLPKIFDPFFSTHPEGTGLGLSITKNIIDQHGGRIEVESKIDVGTKVIITLPAVKQ